jgi:nucleotide-binding universal stress UspA family protein
MLSVQHILAPTDFSERSAYAFGLACSLARDHGARLTVLHVVPPPMAEAVGGVMTPEPDRHEEEWARLRRLLPTDSGIPVEHLLAEGEAGEAIVRAARECNCDLIVMGTHGRTGLGRALLGSVAEKVLRQAPCPVVTVKAPPAAGAAN